MYNGKEFLLRKGILRIIFYRQSRGRFSRDNPFEENKGKKGIGTFLRTRLVSTRTDGVACKAMIDS